MITICKFKQFMFVETVWFNVLNILYFICKLIFLQSIFKPTATIHVSGFYLFVVIWLKPVYKLNLTERMYMYLTTPIYINNSNFLQQICGKIKKYICWNKAEFRPSNRSEKREEFVDQKTKRPKRHIEIQIEHK